MENRLYGLGVEEKFGPKLKLLLMHVIKSQNNNN